MEVNMSMSRRTLIDKFNTLKENYNVTLDQIMQLNTKIEQLEEDQTNYQYSYTNSVTMQDLRACEN